MIAVIGTILVWAIMGIVGVVALIGAFIGLLFFTNWLNKTPSNAHHSYVNQMQWL